jgi:hypothetical protein
VRAWNDQGRAIFSVRADACKRRTEPRKLAGLCPDGSDALGMPLRKRSRLAGCDPPGAPGCNRGIEYIGFWHSSGPRRNRNASPFKQGAALG